MPDERPLAQTCLTIVGAIRRSEPVVIKMLKRKYTRYIDTAPGSLGEISARRRSRPTLNHDQIQANREIDITKDDFRPWVNFDATKTPPLAINLTKICYYLKISRDLFRTFLRKFPHYVITGLGKPPRGTYVGIDVAIDFVQKRCPARVEVLRWLHELELDFLDISAIRQAPEPANSFITANTEAAPAADDPFGYLTTLFGEVGNDGLEGGYSLQLEEQALTDVGVNYE